MECRNKFNSQRAHAIHVLILYVTHEQQEQHDDDIRWNGGDDEQTKI